MKGSFIYPGLDSDNNNNNYEFDPHSDFSLFLEEAKIHSSQAKQSPIAKNGKAQQIVMTQEVKKNKKSWKYVLFPFLRSSSNKKSKETPRNNAPNPKPRGYVSGPIYGTGGASGRYTNRLMWSGPLTGMFQAKKREENEVAYVSLEKANKVPLDDARVYGPLYLVS
ncbi:hypothetical protein vseg_004048 [Gypsophila vaccaria]